MIMVASLNFPADSAAQVAERFQHIPPTPPYVTIYGPWVRGNIEGGITTMSVYEFALADAQGAAAYIDRRFACFADVPGLTVTVEEWLGVDAAMQLYEETGNIEEALSVASLRI